MKKGKTIAVADFQDMIQDALEMLRLKVEKAFAVLDFKEPCLNISKMSPQLVWVA